MEVSETNTKGAELEKGGTQEPRDSRSSQVPVPPHTNVPPITVVTSQEGDSGATVAFDEKVVAARTVLVFGVPSAISHKQLLDFFQMYCGTVHFLSIRRESRVGLVYFADELAMHSALVLGTTYIGDTAIKVREFSMDQGPAVIQLVQDLQKYLLTQRTFVCPAKPAVPKGASPGEKGDTSKQKEKEREKEEPETKIAQNKADIPVYLVWDKDNPPILPRHGEEEVEKVKERMSALPYGMGQQPHKMVIVKRGKNKETSPLIRLVFEKARVSYMKKGVLYNFRDITFFPVAANSVSGHVLRTADGKLLRSGVMYRSACWSRSGGATAEDVRAVFEFLQASCQICTLIDLRTKQEKRDDKNDAMVETIYPTVPLNSQLYHYVTEDGSRQLSCKRFSIDLVTRRMKFKGLVWAAPASVYFKVGYAALARRRSRTQAPQKQAYTVAGSTPLRRHNSHGDLKAVAPTRRRGGSEIAVKPGLRHAHDGTDKEEATPTTTPASQLSARIKEPNGRMTSCPAFDRDSKDSKATNATAEEEEQEEVIDDEDLEALMDSFDEPSVPETASQVFVQRVFNPLGLLGFTKLLFIHSPVEIGKVLRVCIDRRNHPLMFHCTSGKDRTGLIAALILSVCGVARDDIVDSYHLSETYLQYVADEIKKENRTKGLDDTFDGTPKYVMREALAFVEEKYGSIPKYLNDICLFSYMEQEFLRKVMVSDEPDEISDGADKEKAKAAENVHG